MTRDCEKMSVRWPRAVSSGSSDSTNSDLHEASAPLRSISCAAQVSGKRG